MIFDTSAAFGQYTLLETIDTTACIDSSQSNKYYLRVYLIIRWQLLIGHACAIILVFIPGRIWAWAILSPSTSDLVREVINSCLIWYYMSALITIIKASSSGGGNPCRSSVVFFQRISLTNFSFRRLQNTVTKAAKHVLMYWPISMSIAAKNNRLSKKNHKSTFFYVVFKVVSTANNSIRLRLVGLLLPRKCTYLNTPASLLYIYIYIYSCLFSQICLSSSLKLLESSMQSRHKTPRPYPYLVV